MLLFSTGCATSPLASPETGFAYGIRPWIVISDSPCNEVTICWLSSKTVKTRMFFGPDEDSLEVRESEDRPTKLHRVRVENLVPGATYFYAPIFTKTGENEIPEIYHFTSPQGADDPIRIVIVGDMQPKPNEEITLEGGRLVAEGIEREVPDLVIQLGDLSAFGGLFRYWRPLFENISVFSPFVPFQTVAGNHDLYGDGSRNFTRFFPYNFADEKGLYYSFDFGNAHFVMLNGFEIRSGDVSVEQKAWAERDIVSARSRGSDWVFLIIHNTVISTGTEGTMEAILSWLVPFADRMNVDAVFYGHDHHYEHWVVEYGKDGLIFDPSDAPMGNEVHYWCSGGGGARLEIDYGIMTRKQTEFARRMCDTETGELINVVVKQKAWDSSKYIDRSGNPSFGQPYGGRHYYQAADTGTCRTDTDLFGYQYGEQTLHYLLLEINGDEAVITARYPGGDLLEGPDGRHPQKFVLTK